MFNAYKIYIKIPNILLGTKNILKTKNVRYCHSQVVALRPKKPKSSRSEIKYFTDSKHVRTIGGKGGDGCISFLRLWSNENAGPDGGDGGNGSHIIFETSIDVNNFNHVSSVVKGVEGEKGAGRDCHGKNATHTMIKVPIGTVVKNAKGKLVADLRTEKLMFVAARGGSGGKGNHFFATDLEQAPQICEVGAMGEDISYVLELRSMAHIGLIGLPNAGKSTLLSAISRSRSKIASYPFTTLKPHIGMVQYHDYEQIAVADLPGLIMGSHKNKGLGIQFLKHAERCLVLLFVIDFSCSEPWKHYDILINELKMFSADLANRPKIVVANKIDLDDAKINLDMISKKFDVPVIPISAKFGENVADVLTEIRMQYDRHKTIDQ